VLQSIGTNRPMLCTFEHPNVETTSVRPRGVTTGDEHPEELCHRFLRRAGATPGPEGDGHHRRREMQNALHLRGSPNGCEGWHEERAAPGATVSPTGVLNWTDACQREPYPVS
jgi:hypothetical protein